MKLQSAEISNFKRFADLHIRNIPPTARLLVLLGPNGCGKSSFFDALYSHLKMARFYGLDSDLWDYFDRLSSLPNREKIQNFNSEMQKRVRLVFHESGPESPEDYKKSIYLRTAYRHDPSFRNVTISSTGNVLEELRVKRLIDDDKTVESNYRRLIWRLLQQVTTPGLTTDQIMERTIGDLKDTMIRVFGDLVLDALVTPEERGSFTFSKGEISHFLYENLSGGEKAAFDLLLDVVANRVFYNDSLYCIDEPEVHLNTRLQGQMLEELIRLVPCGSQLWIATHSIGMVRKAEELRTANPDEVVFLDFGYRDDGVERNYDRTEVIEPSSPDQSFWSKHYDVALADLGNLIAPERIVLCEGHSTSYGEAFDESCYNRIFAKEFPRTRFISAGSAEDLESRMVRLVPLLRQIVQGTEIITFRDRDDLTEVQVNEAREKGIRVLSGFRNLESLLLSDSVLEKLCTSASAPEASGMLKSARDDALLANRREGRASDDLKPAAQAVHQAARKYLSLDRSGSTKEAFMRDILTPLVTSDTGVYQRLRSDIFGA